MVVHTVRIPYRQGDIFQFKPCFDWHIGRNCDERAIQRYLNDGAGNPNCYLIGGGDLADSIIVTDKRYTKSQDDTKGQAIIDEQVDMLEHLLKPYKDRIIGLGMGNHELTILQRGGSHIMRRVAKRLNTVSLGYQWAIAVTFYHIDKKGKPNGHGKTLRLFGNHGWGGGTRTEGGSITKYSKHMLQYEADMYFYGHDHKLDEALVTFMGIRGKKFIPKDKRLYLAGTFQKTFSMTDEPTWAETRGFHPAPIRGLNVYVQPTDSWFKIWSDL